MQVIDPQEIRNVLSDCQSRSRNPLQIKAIALLLELLDSSSLAPLNEEKQGRHQG